MTTKTQPTVTLSIAKRGGGKELISIPAVKVYKHLAVHKQWNSKITPVNGLHAVHPGSWGYDITHISTGARCSGGYKTQAAAKAAAAEMDEILEQSGGEFSQATLEAMRPIPRKYGGYA